MSFDYKEIRAQQQSSGTQWASYSDLFMVLAFVFLLMYMVSALRTGMISVTARAQVLEVQQELELYESIKGQYLAETSNEQETKIYDQIIQQITLLESESASKKQELEKQVQQQAARESALNQYQQMIVSMVNANVVARAEAVSQLREKQEQNEVLQQTVSKRSADVEDLQQKLQQEAEEIAQIQQRHAAQTQEQEQKFKSLRTQIDDKQNRLASLEQHIQKETTEREALKQAHAAEAREIEEKYREMRQQHEAGQSQIASLNEMLQQEAQEKARLEQAHQQQTRNLEGKFDSLKTLYNDSQNTMAALQQQIEQEAAEKAALQQAMEARTRDLEGTIAALAREQGESESELAALEADLQRQAEEKAALQNASAAELASLEARYQGLQGDYEAKLGEVTSLADQIETSQAEMKDLEAEHEGKLRQLEDKYQGLQNANADNQAEIAELQSSLAATSEELEKALELEKDRRQVAQKIKQDFERAGIKAEVEDDGEVVLDFGGEYFDKGSYELKRGMKERLREAIPVYANSLFSAQTRSGQIAAVEIIGFASPTYGGQPINPRSLSEQNREAVNYNLDLSYERARSIFRYAFDTETLEFDHQETMLPLIKVTGRSFFTEDVNPDDTGNLTQQEFCQIYDCNASQRVIIKFDLKEKETG